MIGLHLHTLAHSITHSYPLSIAFQLHDERAQVQVLLFDRQLLFKLWSSIPFLLTAKCLFLWLYILSLALLSADNGCCCLGITFSVCLFIDQWMKLIIKMIKILIVKEEIRCRDVDVTSWQKHTVEQSIELHYYALCCAPIRASHTNVRYHTLLIKINNIGSSTCFPVTK